MAYCVHCGVELNPAAKECPLCGTPVWEPEIKKDAPPYFPTERTEVAPASKKMMALLITCMLASAALCSGVLNLILWTSRPWSLYVIGAGVMLWIIIVLPMLLRSLPTFFRLTFDVVAVGIYVYLISIYLDGSGWFMGVALPLLAVLCVEVFFLGFVMRDRRRSILSSIALVIGAVGVTALALEFLLDMFILGEWTAGWSLIVFAVCVGLIIPLRVIRRVPSLREEARRRFNI